MLLTLILDIVTMIVKGFVFVYLSAMFLGGFVSVYQEQKIWRNPKLPNLTLVGMFKVYIMNLLWMLLCTIGILLTPFYCLYTGSLNTRKWAHHIVEKFVATTITSTLIGPVEIRGAEHIPDASLHKVPAPVLIANHASQADIAVVYFLNCEWRWIAKSSVMFLPGVGLLMWLADHVFIDRVKKSNKNKNSFTGARHLYTQSNASIQEGVPMFFFPQGTRRLGERLPLKMEHFEWPWKMNHLSFLSVWIFP